jgi:hypothetical protein
MSTENIPRDKIIGAIQIRKRILETLRPSVALEPVKGVNVIENDTMWHSVVGDLLVAIQKAYPDAKVDDVPLDESYTSDERTEEFQVTLGRVNEYSIILTTIYDKKENKTFFILDVELGSGQT